MDKIIVQELANPAGAFARPSQPDTALLAALASAAEPRSGEFVAQELASTAWTFAMAVSAIDLRIVCERSTQQITT